MRVVLWCVLCCVAGARWCAAQVYDFDGGWRLAMGDAAGAEQAGFDDAAWKPVTLPHAWNEDFAYRVSIHDQPTGIAWYRKHFRLPAGVVAGTPGNGGAGNSREGNVGAGNGVAATGGAGNRVFVEFQGVRQAAEVYLNGNLLGRSENGVAPFGFDLTGQLKPGDNVIAVRTDNRWEYREKATGSPVQWNNNNFYSNSGGINKRVLLRVTPAVHQTLPLYSSLGTTGQYVWADQFDLPGHAATVHTESEVRNDSGAPAVVQMRAELRERAGERGDGRSGSDQGAGGRGRGEVLATVTSAAATIAPGAMQVLSTETRATGLHFWSWGYGYLYDVVTSLLVNGKVVDPVTTTTGFRETAFRNGMVYLNGRVMQVHGYAARSTNEWPALGTDVPPWVSDFSNALVVAGNGNMVRWMHVTPARQEIESCDRVGLPMSMPAGDAEGDPKGREWQARVELMRDSIVFNRNSPSILFYESGNKGVSEAHMADMLQVRNQFDPHGGRASGSREMLGSKTAEYGGEMLYIDKSATKPVWAHEYNRDEGARKFWNEQTAPFHTDAPLYNRNQESFTLEDVLTWDDYYRARPGTGRRVSAGGVNISFIDENSHFRGDNNYRRSGEVDAMRIPKDAYFAHQVMWDGWVDPERARAHILGHWNYAAGVTRTVLWWRRRRRWSCG